jgi:hypothetical protein
MPSLDFGYGPGNRYGVGPGMKSVPAVSPGIKSGGLTPEGMLGIGITTQLAGSVASLYTSIVANQIETDYKRHVYDMNTELAKMQAADAMKRGARLEEESHRKTKSLIGSQRAAMAAQGIDISVGSAVDVQADAAARGAADELAIRNNAYREAFGYKMQAFGLAGQASMMGITSRAAENATMATGGANFASGTMRDIMYYRFGKGR